MAETIRYDVLDDRDNDIKKHDNKNHLTDRKNKLRLLEAQIEQAEGVRGQAGYIPLDKSVASSTPATPSKTGA